MLVVDDEPEILAVLTAAFRRALPEVTVVTAPSGEAALARLAERPFDLVLSDNLMPGMSGIDFLARARDVRPDATRVLMTGHPEADLAIRGLNERLLTRFLTKPFRPVEVAEVVRGLLDERRARAQQERAFAHSIDVLRRQVVPPA